jgi:hypothetical protein
MNHYTNYETELINKLYCITQEKHLKNTIKNIDHISSSMVDSLYNDDRINNIYNKKIVAIGTLKKMFVNSNDLEHNIIAHNNDIIIKNYEKNIDKKLNTMEYDKNKKKRDSCSCF